MVQNLTNQNLNANAIFTKLDWADGTKDNKIEASVWNEFARHVECNTINRFIKKENAIATINKYLKKMTDSCKGALSGYIENLQQIQKQDKNIPEQNISTVQQDKEENIPWDLDTPYLSKFSEQCKDKAGQTIEDCDLTITYDKNGFPETLSKLNNENNEIIEINVTRDENGNITGFSELVKENNKEALNQDVTSRTFANRYYNASGKLESYAKYQYDNNVQISRYNNKGQLQELELEQRDKDNNLTLNAHYTSDGNLIDYTRHLNYKWGLYFGSKTANYDASGKLQSVYSAHSFYDTDGKIIKENSSRI